MSESLLKCSISITFSYASDIATVFIPKHNYITRVNICATAWSKLRSSITLCLSSHKWGRARANVSFSVRKCAWNISEMIQTKIIVGMILLILDFMPAFELFWTSVERGSGVFPLQLPVCAW